MGVHAFWFYNFNQIQFSRIFFFFTYNLQGQSVIYEQLITVWTDDYQSYW